MKSVCLGPTYKKTPYGHTDAKSRHQRPRLNATSAYENRVNN